jgi:flavorubredoxin
MNRSPATAGQRVPPTRVDRDTYLIHQIEEAAARPDTFYVNSMVITGREPVVVDTGSSSNGAQWLDDVLDVVDPADVRWIVLSHDDADHTGNLPSLVTVCPEATVVCSRDVFERQPDVFAQVPSRRRRCIHVGDTLDVGDRRLLLVRPPVWDTDATIGVLDQLTGVYWGADAFACLLGDQPVPTVADLAPELWAHGIAMFAHQLMPPSLDLVDGLWFAARCDRTQALGMTALASAHSPLVTDTSIDHAFALLRDLTRVAAGPHAERSLDRHTHPARR